MKSFTSRPLLKIFFSNGLGFYILNAYRFRIFPRFYFSYKKSQFLETGVFFLWWLFEIMWNKAFTFKKP
jgi:hypothetical protein